MSNISADIKGIIRELSLNPSDVLIPLYEMVINSIHAIEERKEKCDYKDRGNIKIKIKRDISQGSLFPNQTIFPIQSLEIIDDGIGFTEENYNSYSIAYSSKKQKVGGKGIGRFAALSVFSNIKIKSVIEGYEENIRKDFDLSAEEGLSEPIKTNTKQEVGTKVLLYNLKSEFIKMSAKFSREDIAEKLLSHCLLFYINGIAPKIEIIEDSTVIPLDSLFHPKKYIKETLQLGLRGQNFTFHFLPNTKKQHDISFCANSRKVKGKKVVSILPIFSSPIIDTEGDELYYDIYVVSPYFDMIVNSSRTDLKFPKEDSEEINEDLGGHLPTEKEVSELSATAIKEIFENELKIRRDKIKSDIGKFLESDDGIGFRHLKLDDSFYDALPDDINEKKLSDKLHEADYIHSKKRRAALDKLNERDYADTEDYRQLIKDYIDLSTDEGLSKLGQYVAHRKVVIDLLEKYLGWNEEKDSYEQEQVLHNLIYTMGGDNSTINYDKHNLWLLDDRLTFHKYIYSDRQIKSHKPVEGISESKKETDIAIYDTVYHYAEKDSFEEVKSVVIFELKRPNRDISYIEFFTQMNEQIEGIVSGSVKDYKGRNIQLPQNTPITFYFVCDTRTFQILRKRAEPDGYFLTPYGTLMRVINTRHIEIMTYQSILNNSRRRNKIFFDKLGINRY